MDWVHYHHGSRRPMSVNFYWQVSEPMTDQETVHLSGQWTFCPCPAHKVKEQRTAHRLTCQNSPCSSPGRKLFVIPPGQVSFRLEDIELYAQTSSGACVCVCLTAGKNQSFTQSVLRPLFLTCTLLFYIWIRLRFSDDLFKFYLTAMISTNVRGVRPLINAADFEEHIAWGFGKVVLVERWSKKSIISFLCLQGDICF